LLWYAKVKIHEGEMKKLLLSVAALGLLAGAASAQDLTSLNTSASLSGSIPTVSPFLVSNTGRILSNGFGSSAATSDITDATFGVTGFASSTNTAGIADAASGSIIVNNFDRAVSVNGAMIGMGTTTVTAGATNSFGGDVDSSADGTVRTIDGITGDLQLSEVDLATGASLAGSNNTSAAIGLQGTSLDFVGSSGTTLVGDTLATAGGSVSGLGDATGTLSIGALTVPAATVAAGVTALQTADAAGIAFSFDDGAGVELAVPSLGGGVIEATGTTASGLSSGFFSATGSTSFGLIAQP
jgi:hypothetical protein